MMSPIKPLEIDTKEQGSATIVTLTGHIATPESQVVSNEFERIIAEGVTKIAVDLKGVNLITSDGLGALIRARKAATENGGMLVLSGVEGNIRDVFKMTRLDKIFTICDTVEEAANALTQS